MSEIRNPQSAVRDPQLRQAIEAYARSRRFSPAVLERWLGAAAAGAAALLEVAEELRLGENQLRDVIEWAEEIAVRDEKGVADVLQADSVRAARSRGLGRNDAVRALREALRRLRFPQLVAVEEQIADCIRALGLPRTVRIVVPEYLQDDELRIEVRARDAAAARASFEQVCRALGDPRFDEIFALLREVP